MSIPGATPQSTTAVTSAVPGGLVEEEGVFGEEGDVDDVLARGDDGLERGETHGAGDRADDEIRAGDDLADDRLGGQVRPDPPDRGPLEPSQVRPD